MLECPAGGKFGLTLDLAMRGCHVSGQGLIRHQGARRPLKRNNIPVSLQSYTRS